MGIVCSLYFDDRFIFLKFLAPAQQQKLLCGFDWLAMRGQDGFVNIYAPERYG